MKNILIIVFCISFLYSDANTKFGFKYGVIAQLASNPDSSISISDSSIISSGDKIRINLGYLSKTSFIVIFKGSKDEFWLVYSNKDSISTLKTADTTYVTALPFSAFEEPPGIETFYLINSKQPLENLQKIIMRYENAPLKAKTKLANRIQALLDEMDPMAKGSLAAVQSRLNKPMVGGVSFRGEGQKGINDMSLTHECNSSNDVIFKKIVINHIARRENNSNK